MERDRAFRIGAVRPVQEFEAAACAVARVASPGARLRGRRRALRQLAGVGLVAVLAACGFHPRGAATYTFKTIFVNGTASPPLAAGVRRALQETGNATIPAAAKDAEVILDIVSVVDDKQVLSLSQSGAVREYELIKRVSFRVHDADGNDWLPPGEITVRRTYSFNETEVLAREMEQDVEQQLVRRLQAARKP